MCETRNEHSVPVWKSTSVRKEWHFIKFSSRSWHTEGNENKFSFGVVFLNGFQKIFPMAKFSDFLFTWMELMKLPKSKAVPTGEKCCKTHCLQFRVNYPLVGTPNVRDHLNQWWELRRFRLFFPLSPEASSLWHWSNSPPTCPGCVKQGWDEMLVLSRWAARAL